MIGSCFAETTPRHAKNHVGSLSGSVVQLRGVVYDLVEPTGNKIVELNFTNGAHAFDTSTNTRTHNGIFCQGRVDNAVAVFLNQWPEQHKGVAIRRCHIFTKDK